MNNASESIKLLQTKLGVSFVFARANETVPSVCQVDSVVYVGAIVNI